MQWHNVCQVNDLVLNSGVCALLGDSQVAIYSLLMDAEVQLFAISNYDPIGNANVMSRGIPGSLSGKPVVASPLYKHHFSLIDGRCIEQPDVALSVFPVKQQGDDILLAMPAAPQSGS